MKKWKVGFILLMIASSVFASTVTMNIKNSGDTVFLIEKGLQQMIYAPEPEITLNKDRIDTFMARSNIPQSSSVKLVYSLQNNSYSPACEFIIQIAQDFSSKLYILKSQQANRLRSNSDLQCTIKINGFNPSTGDTDADLTMSGSN